MATASMNYGASTALTITLASLASDSTKLTGRESTAVSNATDKFLGAWVGGKITTGTSPTTGKTIEVWVYAALNDTPTYPDVLDGTDSAETFPDDGAKFAAMFRARVINTDNTSDQTYAIKPFDVAAVCGFMPKHWGIFITHDTGVALNATAGNHELKYTGYKIDVA